MTVRLTSRIAYRDITESGNANTQRRVICEIIWEKGEAMSLREISKATAYDINAVSGRVNDLKKSNMLHEHNKRKCSLTDRLITPVYIAMDYVPEKTSYDDISIVKDMMKEDEKDVYKEEHKYRPSLPENKSKGWI